MHNKNIHDIAKLLGLKEDNENYYGTYITGDFNGIFDYDRGLLHISITSTYSGQFMYNVMFCISTIDDGVWQAWDSKCDYSLVGAEYRVKEIAEHFMGHMGRGLKLPTEKILNEWLMEKSMWGTFTG